MNDDAPDLRDRPGWAVGALCLSTVLVALLAIVAFTTAADALAPHSPLPDRLHTALVGLPIVAVTYAAYGRLVLRRPASFFMLSRPGREVLAWAGVGLALPAAVVGIHLLVHDVARVGIVTDPTRVVGYALGSVAAGVLAGVVEEVAFRGFLLRLIEEYWSSGAAIGATTVVFALLHHGHAPSGRALLAVTGSALAAGLVLALVAYRTRSVWNAVAIHAGWNAVVGGQVVAVAPPGQVPEPAVVAYRIVGGHPLLTGGDATIAAAPVTTAILLAVAVGVHRFARRPSEGSSGMPGGTGGE